MDAQSHKSLFPHHGSSVVRIAGGGGVGDDVHCASLVWGRRAGAHPQDGSSRRPCPACGSSGQGKSGWLRSDFRRWVRSMTRPPRGAGIPPRRRAEIKPPAARAFAQATPILAHRCRSIAMARSLPHADGRSEDSVSVAVRLDVEHMAMVQEPLDNDVGQGRVAAADVPLGNERRWPCAGERCCRKDDGTVPFKASGLRSRPFFVLLALFASWAAGAMVWSAKHASGRQDPLRVVSASGRGRVLV